IVFSYIEDKDIFEKFYWKMLAQRFVHQASVNDEHEVLMVQKLKEASGSTYTVKLEQMCKDIHTSKTLLDEFRNWCKINTIDKTFDFSIMVLTTSVWPFSVPSTIKIPIQVSTYQMIILLLFNESPEYTVEQIQDETQIELDLLIKILCLLLKEKIFICTDLSIEGQNKIEEENIKINFVIKLNFDYKSATIRRNLNLPIKSLEQKETEETNRTIDKDRALIIQ
ncbi:unnamed protein product, partial [Didymodactylos carnosus]